MEYRTLGRTGCQVSAVGYGAWGIGGKQWLGGDDDESIQSLRRAIELGLNFIDTALAYGDGHSEQLVGRIVRETKSRVYVATKVPPKNRIWPAQSGIGIEQVFPYEYIVASTEESLRNLGMERIDLQQLHVWNPEWLDRDEWRRAIEDLKRSGKVSAFGVSINDHQPDSALGIIRTGLIDTVQVIYNIFDQSPERNLFPLAQERNVGVLARVPLDEGALSGNFTEDVIFPEGDFRNWYFRGDRKRQVVERVSALKQDLLDVPGTLAETALAFILSHPAVSSVIPGMRKLRNVERNCAVPSNSRLCEATLGVLRKHAWDKNFYQ
ncbi:MAG: aldo/keto reductase [Bryobacterales bacterium]|nr:aldo/keto reductase [Bryobacterales bacterium]